MVLVIGTVRDFPMHPAMYELKCYLMFAYACVFVV